LIATGEVESNLEILSEVLNTLKVHGFELNLSKCTFLKRRVEFLGYVLSAEGITMSPRHTEAIDKFRKPSNTHEVQRFLGLTNYFRKFIQNYALKAKPLQDIFVKKRK